MQSAPKRFTTDRRVEFRSTDAAGVMHFSSYFGMMEEAEHEFLRFLGLPLFRDIDGDTVSWPRVSAECNFISPVRFEDVLQIDVSVTKLGVKSVTYAFDFQCKQQDVARGLMTAVCCEIKDTEIRSVPMPRDVSEKLAPYVGPAG